MYGESAYGETPEKDAARRQRYFREDMAKALDELTKRVERLETCRGCGRPIPRYCGDACEMLSALTEEMVRRNRTKPLDSPGDT